MPWKEMTVEEVAKFLGVDVHEVEEKQKLNQMVVKIRKARKLSQAEVAKKMGVTQGRIAQIESGVGTAMVSFDVLLHLLTILGYKFHIVSRKAA